MKRTCTVLILLARFAFAQANIAPVPEDQAATWIDHLVPLPHEISITQKVTIPPGDISIRLRQDAGDIEKQSLTELKDLLRTMAGGAPSGTKFEILIGVLDEAGQVEGVAVDCAARLKELPNRDQAYLIQPVGQSKLVVAALDPKGVYYGVQTLIQLLGPGSTRDEIAIPLASVVDWPDMDERGLWNFDLDLIPWIASLKLNFAKVPTSAGKIEKGKPVRPSISRTKKFPNVLKAGQVRALKAVPNVSHLNYIGAKHGGYKAYPDLAGKGDAAVPNVWYKPRRIRVPCAACPALKRIIAEYMAALASKGAQEISVWLSEFQGQCQCPTCLEAGQLRMETKAAVDGWREARKQYPNLVLRIFYCFGGKSLEDTYQVLMELPPEVKIERCYGIYGDAFNKAAAEGRWLATYAGPPLTRGEYSGMRFYGGSRTKEYIHNVHKCKWKGVYSINYVYSTGAYQRELFDFHVSALAEWTWNLNGRSLKDFARAWATRAGYRQPEKVASWIELMDPVEEVYENPLRSRSWAKVPDLIKTRQALRTAQGFFGGILNAKRMGKQLSTCEQALAIAKGMKTEELILETQYVAAFIRLLKAMNTLQAQAAENQSRERLDATLAEFRRAARDMIEAMNRKTDLLKAEPKSFAEKIKKTHTDLWKDRIDSIASAVSELK
ncbi:MAG: hypothetical protein GXP25_10770 [Planctomycetes bacterium]|nr:hypothetical protein [Planctomycetota bacterium]